jgi:hypothetical protein
MKDGFILLYNKDNVLYPVALSNDEDSIIQLLIKSALGGKVVLDKDNPQGTAVNLMEGRKSK